MLEFLKSPVAEFQDFFVLAGKAVRNLFRRPLYVDDIFIQMDVIGFGGLPIVLLTGAFSGAIFALQSARGLEQYGGTGLVGQLVAITLVREMGPVLTGLMVSGRSASGIASELGSMKVTEQIDAMRALGTDPIAKLVTPRLVATAFMLPVLTVIADFIGLVGGWAVATTLLNQTTSQYWNSAWRGLVWNDLVQGLLKPFVFALIISLVGCWYGLNTKGGTQGVGRATTQAVVVASVWIFITTFFIGKIFVSTQ